MTTAYPTPESSATPDSSETFSVERWSATSASHRDSRADLVLSGAGRRWRAHATGNGAVDALLRAVDTALAPVLGDGVELQTYNVHATGEGHDTAAVVTLSLRQRTDEAHAPSYPGRGTHENILEASLVAYVDGINRLVAHGGIDVAAAAPLPGETDLPGRDEEATDASKRHHDRFMEMFNH
jgi:LeuA allosteric (dimerisation) domain